MTLAGLIHCEPYRCDLEPKTCARRYVLAQQKASRIHLAHCRTCEDGRRRAEGRDIRVPKDGRFLPIYGKGLMRV